MNPLCASITPGNAALVWIDREAGLALAVQSIDRQVLLHNIAAGCWSPAC